MWRGKEETENCRFRVESGDGHRCPPAPEMALMSISRSRKLVDVWWFEGMSLSPEILVMALAFGKEGDSVFLRS